MFDTDAEELIANAIELTEACLNSSLQEINARMARKQFDALTNVHFTNEEALDITCALFSKK